MKKYIVVAALLLVTGCSANPNLTNKQIHTRSKTPTITAAPNVTQASSIATPSLGKSSISMKGSRFSDPNWLFDDGDQAHVRTPRTHYPKVKNPTAQYPVTQNPTTQNPTTQNPTEQPSTSLQFDQQVLQIVNSERAKAGLSPLSMDSNLSNMALVKAQDLINNNYFDHTSPTYGSPFDMMKKFQITYNAAGENIAKGQPTPEQVMNDWMNSEGHKANILSSSFTHIGIGYFKGAWVQEFTG
ncbi:CAP domain-containing protein [Paenibacillus sp. Soil522]|uniref:CAP domain-containing protein n=1 Tax=Paenibacillus sp. Soil522 TaxID=1736388 RepID=UPI0006FB6B59|nr:CAP domain-containing protein [Paenibacillus sp. Soil522]KRE49603.1 SCP-like extracellular [Paenibacillus sp. Soil522]